MHTLQDIRVNLNSDDKNMQHEPKAGDGVKNQLAGFREQFVEEAIVESYEPDENNTTLEGTDESRHDQKEISETKAWMHVYKFLR